MLEVGCGRGDFLRLARAAGFSVAGCDFFGGQKPVDTTLMLYDGTLTQAKLRDNSYDIVVIRNVLEHLFDPNIDLQEIRRILKPNGYVYVKVPNGLYGAIIKKCGNEKKVGVPFREIRNERLPVRAGRERIRR
jgi:2-polyprenyl-3-methyl-5-hydroxy-6-metoxy-1,4-benzoquinol methylase